MEQGQFHKAFTGGESLPDRTVGIFKRGGL